MLVYFMAIRSIARSTGKCYSHWVHLVVIRYFSPILVYCTSKNLATLECCRSDIFVDFHRSTKESWSAKIKYRLLKIASIGE
jgi:hypothetical protein